MTARNDRGEKESDRTDLLLIDAKTIGKIKNFLEYSLGGERTGIFLDKIRPLVPFEVYSFLMLLFVQSKKGETRFDGMLHKDLKPKDWSDSDEASFITLKLSPLNEPGWDREVGD